MLLKNPRLRAAVLILAGPLFWASRLLCVPGKTLGLTDQQRFELSRGLADALAAPERLSAGDIAAVGLPWGRDGARRLALLRGPSRRQAR